MINSCRLRAKWSRGARKFTPPAEKVPLLPRPDDTPVSLMQYLMAHVHLARLWRERCDAELTWFLASLRGELPPKRAELRNWAVKHVTLPKVQYFLALEVLTTRLGVRPQDAQP